MKQKFRSLVFKFLAVILSYFLLLTIFPPKTFAAFLPPVVSDTQTEFFDGNGWQSSQATWVHPGWPHIDDATWIWKSATVDLDKLTSGEGPIAFRRNFNLSTTTKGTLKITADNAYSVALDDNLIGADGHLDPTGVETLDWQTIETYSIPNISAGNHTLSFQVTNYNHPTLNFTENPAGLLYRLDLESTTPTPFLDLPWDYQSKGLNFTEASQQINSFFDHDYPLLSSGLSEPDSSKNTLTNFRGQFKTNLDYSSHDGYDYGKPASVNIGDPVLAAAAGCASYAQTGAGGNIIKINHSNGYETRYLHLQDDRLVTRSSSCVQVTKGQQIGRVGATGNVIPSGDLGAHIHFMVVQDKNNDGNFDDNIPDGIVDPFGWQSTDPDPWPNFSFSYNGQNRTGNQSNYLWLNAIANLSSQLSSNAGFFHLEQYSFNFPQNSTNQLLNIEIQAEPSARPSESLRSIGDTIKVTATDLLGNIVNTFQNLFAITVDFSSFDISSYDPDTIAIYSSQDGVNWTKENTTIDPIAKTASAQLNHLTHFALMAERRDTTAPTTTATLSGIQGQAGWFRSDVQLSLNVEDNQDGLGVDYTLYKVNDEDWKQYSSSVNFSTEGNYTVQFYSGDKDENIENIKSISFNIDKTSPVATINVTPGTIWPPNGKMVNILISGSASDNNGIYLIKVDDEYHEVEPAVANFGQTIQLPASRRDDDFDGRHYKIKVFDLTGNEASNFAEIVVLHDQRK